MGGAGGWKVTIGGPASIGDHIRAVYSAGGERDFDYHFMGEQVYQHPFTVVTCHADEVPPASESGQALGRHLNGYRIGFDLGASDLKVSAVVNGEPIFSDEIVWEPVEQTDPAYHYERISCRAQTGAVQDATAGRHRRQLGRRLRRQPATGRLSVPRHPGRALRRDPHDVSAHPR